MVHRVVFAMRMSLFYVWLQVKQACWNCEYEIEKREAEDRNMINIVWHDAYICNRSLKATKYCIELYV
ncbi:hypothetical protein ACB092_12G165700 [Castanea dentata]